MIKLKKSYDLKKRKKQGSIVYSCISGYPASVDYICLLEIKRLKEIVFLGYHN